MTGKQIRVLLVEDEDAYRDLIQAVLGQARAAQFSITHVRHHEDALQQLEQARFDVVLLDLTLPDRQGLATYTEVKAASPAVPVIVLTGVDDEKLALHAVREGAQDYLVKGQVDAKMLVRVVLYAIERKTAGEALRESEEFFRLISENVTDLIAVLDRDGRRLYNSPSYRRLLGDPTSLLGTSSFDEVHPEDRQHIRDLFEGTLRTGIGQRAEYRLLLKDGRVRHIESQGSAIHDETGKPCKLVVVSRDITERRETVETLRNALSDLKRSHEELKAAQMQLIQAEKIEAISTFAGGVAHEVKNPLQAIVLGLDYLKAHGGMTDEVAGAVLNDMESAVERADGIIRGLLEFSAYSQRHVQDEDLNEIIEQALWSVQRELAEAPIQLVKELAVRLPPLRIDFKTLKHVFINLFVNGLRGMPEGGTLLVRSLSCTVRDSSPLLPTLPAHWKPEDELIAAQIERCFGVGDTSFRTKLPVPPAAVRPGGLGLTVVRKIVELYGGVLSVANGKEPASKTTLVFRVQARI